MKVRITTMAVMGVLIAALGCDQNQPTGPTTADFNAAREKLAAKVKDQGGKKPPAAAQAKKPSPADVAPQMQEGGFASVETGYRYDPRGKRDPFRSFEWEQLEIELSQAGARGPLEQFDVAQLTVVGVVWSNQNARALVEDPSGMSYIVAHGARIGKNDGRVTKIADNLVVVRETYVDLMGEETTKDIEMRVRASEGG